LGKTLPAMHGRTFRSAVICLVFFLGFAAFFLSQISVAEERLVQDNIPIFAKEVFVPFKEHATPEYFCINASLEKPSSYLLIFANSDLQIDAVNITEPNGEEVTVNENFSFQTSDSGIYTVSVCGYYLLESELREVWGGKKPNPWSTGPPGWDSWKSQGSGEPAPPESQTVYVNIFELVEKMEDVRPYSLLLYAGSGLLVTGVVLSPSAILPARKKKDLA